MNTAMLLSRHDVLRTHNYCNYKIKCTQNADCLTNACAESDT